jgi:hypothetical protein
MAVTNPQKCGQAGWEKNRRWRAKETIDNAGDASDGNHAVCHCS